MPKYRPTSCPHLSRSRGTQCGARPPCECVREGSSEEHLRTRAGMVMEGRGGGSDVQGGGPREIFRLFGTLGSGR